MSKNKLTEKTFSYSLKVLEVYKKLIPETEPGKLFLKSGTEIGRLAAKAEFAKDKEETQQTILDASVAAEESKYWNNLIYKVGYINESDWKELNNDIKELTKMFSSIIHVSGLIKKR